MENSWLYIVPSSTHKKILGKKWLEDQDAIIHSKGQKLELRKHNMTICIVRRWRQDLRNVTRSRYASAKTLVSWSKQVPICKVTIEDINKAPRDKPNLSIEEVRDRLPAQVKSFAHLFADDNGANKLPPSRGHLDHAINLRQENG